MRHKPDSHYPAFSNYLPPIFCPSVFCPPPRSFAPRSWGAKGRGGGMGGGQNTRGQKSCTRKSYLCALTRYLIGLYILLKRFISLKRFNSPKQFQVFFSLELGSVNIPLQKKTELGRQYTPTPIPFLRMCLININEI